MLIPIRRYIRSSDVIDDILINTNYVISITPCEDKEVQIHSIIVMESFDIPNDGPRIIYSTYLVSYIKGLVTKGKNRNQEEEK